MAPYSGKAQPYLDAIADGFFESQIFRDLVLVGTRVARDYIGANVLVEEQRMVRWADGETKQPFWSNYFCGKDSKCTCRIEGSKGLESDAIFFLRNVADRVLAVHVEFKHRGEPFGFGQPESYPLRAKCFSETCASRKTVNKHDDWVTVLFCGDDTLSDPRIRYFDRVIAHQEAKRFVAKWPN